MAGIGSLFGVFTGIKGKLLLFAGLVVLVGLGLNSLDLLDPDKGVRQGPERPSMSSRLTDSTHALAEYSRSVTWGDAAIRLGLSFGIAMIFATLLRAFVRTMITFVFVAFLVCWGLHSQGMIDPFWEDLAISPAEISTWAKGQFETAKGFVGGVLPSTGAAVAGFLFGLRK